MEVSKFRAEEAQSSSCSGSDPAITAHLRVSARVTAIVHLTGRCRTVPSLSPEQVQGCACRDCRLHCAAHTPRLQKQLRIKEPKSSSCLVPLITPQAWPCLYSELQQQDFMGTSFLFSNRNYGQSCFLVRKFYSSLNDLKKRTFSRDRICLVHG